MFPEARGIEFLIIAALALIVVGPKELPGLLRKLGQFVGKMRNIANEFRASFDEMARQSELDDLRKQVEEMRSQANQVASFDPTGTTDSLSESYMAPDPQPEPVIEAEAVAKPKRAPRKAPAKPAAKTVEPPAKPAKRRAAKTPS